MMEKFQKYLLSFVILTAIFFVTFLGLFKLSIEASFVVYMVAVFGVLFIIAYSYWDNKRREK